MHKYSIEIKWGIIFVIMMIVWMTLEKITGLHGEHIDKHPIFTNLIAIPAILIFVLALRDKKKNSFGGNMTFKQGFITGLFITIVVAILSPVVQLIVSNVISIEYFDNAINYAVANEKMTREAAEKYFNLNNYLVSGFIGAIFMGVITSALVALFVRSKQA